MTLVEQRRRPRIDWLTSDRVVTPDGAVRSWWNPDHPGYAYPEIAGYLLSLLSFEGSSTLEVRDRVARRLVADISPAGGVGRGGNDYVFDSAMALAGLIAHEAAGGTIPDARAIDRLFGYIADTLLRGRGYTGPAASGDPTHWSLSYGCHLLKTPISLIAYDARRPTGTADALIDQLFRDLTPLYDHGRFRVNAASNLSYLHAHCYAIEGLIAMNEIDSRCEELIAGGATWLASIQDTSGGIRARHDGSSAFGPLRSDVTSQAVRIWATVDRERFAGQIEAGLRFLESMTSRIGGLRYEPGSDDVNTWATIFAIQAFRWAEQGGTWQWIA